MTIGLAFDAQVLRQPRYAPVLTKLDLLLFPELVDGGYAALARDARPHRMGDEFLDLFRRTSRDYALCCVAGSTYFDDGARARTNTSLVFTHGRLIHRYDKIHLFKPTSDERYFGRGKVARVFTLRIGSRTMGVGIVICYDLRFPEVVRTLAMQGMNLLLVPARWPRVRDDPWATLLKARAIENQIFVVGCNALGEEGGYSYAFDPLGESVFSNRRKRRSPLYTFAIDLERIHSAKRFHNNLNDAVFLKHRA